MKRVLSAVALVAVVVLAGCNEKQDASPATSTTTSETTQITPIDEPPATDETSSEPQPEIKPLPAGVTTLDVPRIFQKLAPYVTQGLNGASFGASSAYALDGPVLGADCPAQEGALPAYDGNGNSWVLLCDVPNSLAAVAYLDNSGALIPDSVTYVLLKGVAISRDGDTYAYDVYDEAGIQLTAEGVGGFDKYDALAYWTLNDFTVNYLGGKSLQEFMAS